MSKSKPCENSRNLIEAMISAGPFGSVDNPRFWAFDAYGRRALVGCVRAGWIQVQGHGLRTVWTVSEAGRLTVGRKALEPAVLFVNDGKI